MVFFSQKMIQYDLSNQCFFKIIIFLHPSAPCCRGGRFPVKKDEKEQMGLWGGWAIRVSIRQFFVNRVPRNLCENTAFY